jgi:hypothetical protein
MPSRAPTSPSISALRINFHRYRMPPAPVMNLPLAHAGRAAHESAAPILPIRWQHAITTVCREAAIPRGLKRAGAPPPACAPPVHQPARVSCTAQCFPLPVPMPVVAVLPVGE